MADDAHVLPGAFRPPAEWWRLHRAERLTPEGFRDTSLLGKEIDCRAIVHAARKVMNAPARSTPRKLVVMQLVDLYSAAKLPLPRLVLRALDAALDLDGHFAMVLRNERIAVLHRDGLKQKEIAAQLHVSPKTVQRYSDKAPDPWPEAPASNHAKPGHNMNASRERNDQF